MKKTYNIKVQEKNKLLLLFILATINYLMIIYPSSQNIVYLTLILVAATLYDTRIGLSLWIITICTSGLFEVQHNMSTFNSLLLSITGALLVKEAIYIFRVGKLKYKRPIMIFAVMFLFSSLLSYIFNLSEASYTSNIALLCFLIILVFIARLCHQNPQAINFFLHAFIISAISVLLFSVPDLMVGGFRRFNAAGNVRSMANVVGYSLFTLLISLIYRDHILSTYSFLSFPFIKRNRILHLLLISFFSIALLMTGSRGVILSVGASFGMMLIFSVAWKRKIQKVNKGYFIAAFFMIVVAILITVNYSSIETEVARRILPSSMSNSANSYVGNIRWQIWKTSIGEMSTMQWFFGAGLAQFRNLAAKGGFDYYAHSVYVDTFVSLGLIGFIVLFLFISKVFFVTIKTKNIISLGLLSYLIISFFTHGVLLNGFFWIGLAIICGTTYRNI